MSNPLGSTSSYADHHPLRWPSRAMSTSTWRCAGSTTPYISSIWFRYADLVGALPVSMRDRVDGATPSWAATSSSLYPLDSRSLRSSVPRRRRRTVGPVVIEDPPSLRGHHDSG